MAVNAYILIEAEPGRVKEMVIEIAKIKGVKSACGVTGPYDIIARLETRDIDALGTLITRKFQVLDGVRKTITCLCTFCAD